MADQKNKIGWNLPEDNPSDAAAPDDGHFLPTAPELIPNLPRIPNQTSITNPCPDGSKYAYGQCTLPSEVTEVSRHHQPVNAFVPPSQNLFQLENGEFWLKGGNGSIPAGAVQGGQEADGEPLYIARAEFKGSLTPGKLGPHGCYISWGTAEHKVDEYAVLCNLRGSWVVASGGNVPDRAVKGGFSETGEPLFIGRANHKGNPTPGKVQPSQKVCYVAYGGKEVAYAAYEVFVADE